MRIKPARNPGGVVVEIGPNDRQEIPCLDAKSLSAPLPVFNIKRILVPVDFSDCSKKALKYALPLASQFDAELTLLHVVQPAQGVPEMPSLDVQVLAAAEKSLEALRSTLPAAVASSNSVVREGNPYAEIVAAAKELDADLIVLSTHGRTGLAHVLLGSTAEKVVRHAGCPVLIVREREHEFVVG